MLFKKRKGFILIFTLWVLSFLTLLAVAVAAGIRQKIVLIEKLEQRSRSHHLLEAVVKYSLNYVTNQLSKAEQAYTVNLKINLHNNPSEFGRFDLAQDSAVISYTLPDQGENFGVIDEERKINLNITNVSTLQRLIEKVLAVKLEEARELAESILDWRQFGQSTVKGFFSDEYYANLKYPYPKKDANYETLDELLLVKGITKEIYEKLIDYVTIYGDGRVNINTASAAVLYALGLDETLIEKILLARQGKDRLDATWDDHAFLKTFDVPTEINAIVKLEPFEVHAIDALNRQNLLTSTSSYYSVYAQAYLAHQEFPRRVRAIISTRENAIAYWAERS